MNRVERVHTSLKDAALKNPHFQIKDLQNHVNNLPLTNVPKNLLVTPRELHQTYNLDLISKVNKFLLEKAETRIIEQKKNREPNLNRFSNTFSIGDVVKSNKLSGKGLDFGVVIDTRGDKIAVLESIPCGREIVCHVSDLKRIPFSKENIKTLLKN